MNRISKTKGLLVAAVMAVLSVAAMAQTTTGGPTYDMSDGLEAITTSSWGFLDTNKVGIFTVAGFFIGLGLIIALVRRFGARPRI